MAPRKRHALFRKHPRYPPTDAGSAADTCNIKQRPVSSLPTRLFSNRAISSIVRSPSGKHGPIANSPERTGAKSAAQLRRKQPFHHRPVVQEYVAIETAKRQG